MADAVNPQAMRIALCNEVLQPLTFLEQCRLAAAMGYDALEVAPFTLAEDPLQISDTEARQYACIAQDHGIAISGLHWLLVAPRGLSISSADATLRARTARAMERMVELCTLLGGTYLVHGSPQQRATPPGSSAPEAWARVRDCLSQAARHAQACHVTYCLEPLSTRETDIVNTVQQAVQMISEVASPALKTMIDCSAAGQVENETLPALVQRWVPTGHIAHVQVNDPNRRGPGQGTMRFAPILRSLAALRREGHYHGIIAVEPFDYVPDGPGCAARAIGYLRGVLEEIEDDG
ncbi:MAG TPA: sugar phosphate isomerase/epimerase family protein [Castellaniella sp.]|uniref:sugar phosphate isomerase/epimerase family protein n=1 Tax=Castellaniella sp. TaxID=1955812 RepID=UPI002F0D3389